MAEVMLRVEEASDKKKRRIPVVILSCLLVFALIGGGTLAYLTVTTDPVGNVFTAGNIDAELIEAEWDSTGSTLAKKMLPGVTAPKDPLIKNTSAIDESEYVGMKLIFQKASEVDVSGKPTAWTTMSEDEITALLKGVGTTTDGSNVTTAGLVTEADWGARIDTAANVTAVEPGQRVYLYNAAIIKDASTKTIFSNVGIVPDAGNGNWDGTLANVTKDNFMTWIYADNGCKGHFQITVQGAAVQSTGMTDRSDAIDPILTLFGYTPQP